MFDIPIRLGLWSANREGIINYRAYVPINLCDLEGTLNMKNSRT